MKNEGCEFLPGSRQAPVTAATFTSVSAEETSLARRELGRRLRRLRNAAGLTQEQIADEAELSAATMRRIENGLGSVKVGTVLALCRAYGADGDTTNALVALAKNTRGKGLWEDASVVPDWFGLYLGLERFARQIELWGPLIVPGILQTPAYARAVLSHEPGADEATIGDRAEVRMRRQAAVLGGKQVTAVLGAGALALDVGAPGIVEEQVEYLREVAERDNVYVGVVPWAAGPRQARCPFNILSFPEEEDPDVAYVELETGAVYLEKAGELVTYRASFAWLREQSVPVKEYES